MPERSLSQHAAAPLGPVPLSPLSTEIGPYRVVRELGRGGMGVVYEAVHAQLGKRVALKLMQAEGSRTSAQTERFIREGRAACNVRHPNVIEVLDLGSHEGLPYLVMTMLDGITLGELLQASQRLPLPAVLDLMLPILSAVSAAHAAGVVHRDLKPSNIMLARVADQLQPTLLDFGASKLQEPSATPLTTSGMLVGTLPYMSAEQVHASQHADARSDQYSLAVIVYECLVGERPFDAHSTYDLMLAIVTAPVVAPSALVADLPPALDGVLLRALDRDPSARFPSVVAFAQALLTFAPPDRCERFRSEFRHDPSARREAVTPQPSADVTLPDTDRTQRAPAVDTEPGPTSNAIPTRTNGRSRQQSVAGLLAVFSIASALGLRGETALPSSPRAHAVVHPANLTQIATALHLEAPQSVKLTDPETLPEPQLVECSRESAAPRVTRAPALRAHRSSSHAPAAERPRSRSIEVGVNDAPILE